MDIWTERLAPRHLSLLPSWLTRADGALTPNDLPGSAEELASWYARCAAEPGRLDCLVSVYETPVGLAGLCPRCGQGETAALYLLLGERSYNPLRTGSYMALRMLDRAFLELGFARAEVQVFARHAWFLDVLERMGFARAATEGDRVLLGVEKEEFLQRKYLF